LRIEAGSAGVAQLQEDNASNQQDEPRTQAEAEIAHKAFDEHDGKRHKQRAEPEPESEPQPCQDMQYGQRGQSDRAGIESEQTHLDKPEGYRHVRLPFPISPPCPRLPKARGQLQEGANPRSRKGVPA
jgi:hypothetical protein